MKDDEKWGGFDEMVKTHSKAAQSKAEGNEGDQDQATLPMSDELYWALKRLIITECVLWGDRCGGAIDEYGRRH